MHVSVCHFYNYLLFSSIWQNLTSTKATKNPTTSHPTLPILRKTEQRLPLYSTSFPPKNCSFCQGGSWKEKRDQTRQWLPCCPFLPGIGRGKEGEPTWQENEHHIIFHWWLGLEGEEAVSKQYYFLSLLLPTPSESINGGTAAASSLSLSPPVPSHAWRMTGIAASILAVPSTIHHGRGVSGIFAAVLPLPLPPLHLTKGRAAERLPTVTFLTLSSCHSYLSYTSFLWMLEAWMASPDYPHGKLLIWIHS